jgi:quercetin dioxygenase-like cupin family protein
MFWIGVALAADGVVVDGGKAPTFSIADGRGTAKLLLGGPEAAVDHLVLAAGATVPAHKHETSAEILYVEEGRVRMTIAGKVLEAGPGDVVYVPKDTEHSAVVLGTMAPLRAVQVYVGPGPEQRFATGARAVEE